MKTIRLLILMTLSIGLLSISCKKEEEHVIKEGEYGLIYLDENGVTTKAYYFAQAGNTDILEGVEYTVVDSAMLYAMTESGEYQDYTTVVTTLVSNMSELFAGGFKPIGDFNQDISSWDVSNVTDMNRMFRQSSFNQDISVWEVSNVTNMAAMFLLAGEFNQDISNWDVSNVTNMANMFSAALTFNQDISNWDVSNVSNMDGMFGKSYVFAGGTKGAISFNQDLSKWDISNVTNCSEFSVEATSWTLPKPNFTNCDCGCD